MGIIAYGGGKFYLAPKLIELIPPHHLYVEVFAGGANLLFTKERSGLEILNDLNRNLYALYKVLSEPLSYKKWSRKVRRFLISRDIFNECKLQLQKDDIDIIDRAAIYYYLNRCSMFGMCTSFGISRGKKRATLYKDLKDAHKRLEGVIVENKSFEKIIKIYDSPETFFYLDPPYVMETRTGGKMYDHEMTNEQHELLLDLLLNIKGKALLSGYDNQLYNDKLSGWNKKKYEQLLQLGRNTMTGVNIQTRTEVVWYNYNLIDLFNQEGL